MRIAFHIDPTLGQMDSLCRSVEGRKRCLICDDRQMREIILVLEELCANIINHGDANRIDVELIKENNELAVTIVDDGSPFDPTKMEEADTTVSLEERCAGGLGIHLVNHYTDSFVYTREEKTNIVTLKKQL